jgi:hypothetical protein
MADEEQLFTVWKTPCVGNGPSQQLATNQTTEQALETALQEFNALLASTPDGIGHAVNNGFCFCGGPDACHVFFVPQSG